MNYELFCIFVLVNKKKEKLHVMEASVLYKKSYTNQYKDTNHQRWLILHRPDD